jgi:hypothetical protein
MQKDTLSKTFNHTFTFTSLDGSKLVRIDDRWTHVLDLIIAEKGFVLGRDSSMFY